MTLQQARKLIEKYPDHDSYVEKKNQASINNGDADVSIQASMFWAKAKDMIWLADNYQPVGCHHKKANGFSAWMFQSSSSETGERWRELNIMVCERCGDIKVSGHENGFHFEHIFHIFHSDAIRAIIKQANFFNENELFVEASSDKDYEEVLADHNNLVKELDILLNGAGAALRPSLCDIVAQVRDMNIPSKDKEIERLRELVAGYEKEVADMDNIIKSLH